MIYKLLLKFLYLKIFLILIIPLVIIGIIILIDDGLPIFHWSKRFGKNKKIFLMPKFRTMRSNAPDVATHLLNNPNKYITKSGSFLRKTSLDELPQIWSCFTGKMNLIGPRPALFNQNDLINLRDNYSINFMKPGITGYAQINGRDELSLEEKVKMEKYYCDNKSIYLNLKIIYLTLYHLIKRKNISH